MKNFFIILINFILVLFLLISVELILNIQEFTEEHNIPAVKVFNNPYRQELLHILHDYYFDFDNTFESRSPVLTDNKPITIFMECSYTYGMHLNQKDTPHEIYSKISNESSYNFGRPATSPREILAILRYNFNVNDKNNIKYVIYTYIPDHKKRIYDDMCKYRYDFKERNNKLVQRYFIPFFDQLKCVRAFKLYWYYKRGGSCNIETLKKFALYINEISREIKHQLKYGNKDTKFIILIYDEDECDYIWENIVSNNDNIYLIKVKDLLPFDYLTGEWTEDTVGHPSAKLWKTLIPILYKKINN